MADERKLIVANWEQARKLILLQLHEKLLRTRCWPFHCHSTFEANWKGEKAWWVGALWADWNSNRFEVSSFIVCSSKPFLDQIVTYSEKVDLIQQLGMTSSVVEWRRSSRALPKVKLAPKKRSRSLFGGLLLAWSTAALWIPAKPLQLRSVLSKSMRCTKTHKACSQYWSQNGSSSPHQHLITCHTTNTSAVEWMGYKVVLHMPYSLDLSLTTTSSSVSTTLQGKYYHNQ